MTDRRGYWTVGVINVNYQLSFISVCFCNYMLHKRFIKAQRKKGRFRPAVDLTFPNSGGNSTMHTLSILINPASCYAAYAGLFTCVTGVIACWVPPKRGWPTVHEHILCRHRRRTDAGALITRCLHCAGCLDTEFKGGGERSSVTFKFELEIRNWHIWQERVCVNMFFTALNVTSLSSLRSHPRA